ncbi:MAG: hypothetical protein JO343_10430 [Candidatus Eremiobacteraeota bacterium]|nr:hypothetical protein [Candidatus Eremiobacteraeota bacterium]
MSLEFLNTLGTLATTVVVAAAAVAALIQLKHLRAGNQINAQLAIGENYYGPDFMQQLNLIRSKLPVAIEDPEFREYVAAFVRGLVPSQPVPPEYIELGRSAISVCNTNEDLSMLVKNGIIDKKIFLERYSATLIRQWVFLEKFIGFSRAVGSAFSWENFELLVVLSQDWKSQHPAGRYPKGVRRLEPRNPWPIPATTSS